MLRLEANVHIHAGDAQAVAEAILAGLTLQRALENEPVLVSQLVRLAIFGAAADELKSALASVTFSAQDLARMQQALARIDWRKSLLPTFYGERAFGLQMLEGQSAAHPTLSTAVLNVLGAPDKARYLDIVGEFITISEKPWPELLGESRSIDNKYRAANSRWQFPAGSVTAALEATVSAVVRAELTRRLALVAVAVAVERFQQQHGAPPIDLAALAPTYLDEVPDDPTSGAPLSYRAHDGGYVLFSATKAFPLPSGESPDTETGANPSFVFRRTATEEPAEK